MPRNQEAARSAGFENYWQLRSYDHISANALRDTVRLHGYKVPSSALKNHVIRRMERVQRGLICYDKCTDKELTQFTLSRHLVFRAVSCRQTIMAALMQADD